jgi:hypothetical protein
MAFEAVMMMEAHDDADFRLTLKQAGIEAVMGTLP